jgi:hypothetical protein
MLIRCLELSTLLDVAFTNQSKMSQYFNLPIRYGNKGETYQFSLF